MYSVDTALKITGVKDRSDEALRCIRWRVKRDRALEGRFSRAIWAPNCTLIAATLCVMHVRDSVGELFTAEVCAFSFRLGSFEVEAPYPSPLTRYRSKLQTKPPTPILTFCAMATQFCGFGGIAGHDAKRAVLDSIGEAHPVDQWDARPHIACPLFATACEMTAST